MSNPKVFEYAKEIGLTPLALMDKIREWQIPVKSHMAELNPELLEQLKAKLRNPDKSAETAKPKKAAVKKPTAAKKPVAAKKKMAEAPVTKKSVAAAATTIVPAKAATSSKSTVVIRKKENEIVVAEAAVDKETIEDTTLDAAEAEVEEFVEAPVVQPTLVKVTPQAPLPSVQKAPPLKTTIKVQTPITENKLNVTTPTAVAAKAPDVAMPTAPVAPAAMPQTAAPAPTPAAHAAAVARKKEVTVGTSGVASSATPMNIGRKNIVGRMDLARVQNPGGPQRPTPTPGGGANRATGGFASGTRPAAGNRNLRAGFVAQPTYTDVPSLDDIQNNKKNLDKRSKKLESATPSATPKEKELENLKDFNAVEFRKREMVFQPKKRKGLLNRESMKTQLTTPKASKRVVKVNGSMKVSDLAQDMGLKASQLIKVLVSNGVMANMNMVLDFDTIALITPELGWEAQNILKTAEDIADETVFGDLNAEKIIRPPVVTIMGHVDHGKTSLLDCIRSTSVASGEAGGITQHIGAYSVTLEDKSVITFLDTPGHEAFTAMRMRGANATDIAVIVVAADDGMMPQTQEAISHAKAAGVPIIVAINKMDKPGANPDKIKQQLTEMELVPEEWGGTTIYVPVSALKKTGIKELLVQIHLVAEIQELKANPKRSGTGIVIESKLEKGKGPVATLLVKDGTVKIGQYIVAGIMKGKVRSMVNDKGVRVEEVGPGYPVEVLGLESTPSAGDRFDIVIDEETAERATTVRKEKAALGQQKTGKLSIEQIFAKSTQGDVKELSVILKADVHGSLEAVQGMLAKISTPEVTVKVIHSGVSGINESDILLAQTARAIVIGFNVRPDTGAQSKAKQTGVDVRTYSIVYELVDDLKRVMGGLLTPDVVEKVMGRAEVRNIFSVPKMGVIAGCFVVDGKIQRSNQVRLLRDGKIVYEGKIASLKRFKDDAKEVAQGFECGLGIENYNDLKVGDVIEAFVKEEVARVLTHSEAQA